MSYLPKIGCAATSVGALISFYFYGASLEGENNYPEHVEHDDSQDEFGNSLLLNRSEHLGVIDTQAPIADDKHALPPNPAEPIVVSKNNGDAPETPSPTTTEAKTDLVVAIFDKPEHTNHLEQEGGDARNPALTPATITQSSFVGKGDSIISISKQHHISSDDITNLLYKSGIKHSSFNINMGDELVFNTLNNQLTSLAVISKSPRYTVFERTENGRFKKTHKDFPSVDNLVVKKFTISKSLYEDGKKQGVSASTISQIADLLRNKVNLKQIPHDTLVSIVVNESTVRGSIVKTTLKAINVSQGQSTLFEAYRFKSDKESGFYDSEGNSVVPTFRRHPIDNPIITSKFNPKRKHPILKKVRPHRGTDYGNWKGTPIYAISDAEVLFAGNRGGFGKAVILKHPEGIETLSAHMSAFAKGIKKGGFVKKGEVVGYIGNTGLSTGYHLHFEVKKDGVHVDSLAIELPITEKASSIPDFKKSITNSVMLLRN